MKNKVNGKGSSPANIKNERIESKWYLLDNMIDPIKKLEKNHSSEALDGVKNETQEMQMSFFNLDDPLLEEIKDEILNIDINTLTPVEALMKLNEIKRMLIKK